MILDCFVGTNERMRNAFMLHRLFVPCLNACPKKARQHVIILMSHPGWLDYLLFHSFWIKSSSDSFFFVFCEHVLFLVFAHVESDRERCTFLDILFGFNRRVPHQRMNGNGTVTFLSNYFPDICRFSQKSAHRIRSTLYHTINKSQGKTDLHERHSQNMSLPQEPNKQ